MTTKRSLLLSLAKIDLVAYPILVTLIGYFAFFTGGYKASDLIYLPIDVGIGALATLVMEWINMHRKATRLIDNVNDEKYDRLQVKKDLLFFPLYIGFQFIVEWCFGVSLVLLLMFVNMEMTLMGAMPLILLLPIMAMVNFNVGYFIAENSLSEILSSESIRDAELPDGSYKKVSLNMRIALLVLSVILIPVVIFGYLLYLQDAKLIVMDNIGLHVGFIVVLSVITITASLNLLMKNIKKSNVMLMSALKAIKEGNLAITGVPMITTSEIGAISQNANSLIKKLRDVITSVQQSTEVVNESSQNIQEASESLSQSASEQAAGIEEISSTIEEILSTVSQNAENAVQAERLAQNSYNLAEKGNSVMDEAVNAIDKINKSSEKISDIIGIMNGIAFQTNLLALNAAVEAARAGEHGRSFAVVAGEVRNLAQRSGDSSKEIEGLIKASVDQVAEGTRLAGDSGSSLKEIFEAISQVRQMISEITAASQEQKLGLSQIADTVTETDTMTQQNASAAEELTTTAENLRSNADVLRQAVSYFRV